MIAVTIVFYFVIFTCYRCCTSTIEEFQDTLNTLSAICTENECEYIIIGSDFNTDISRNTAFTSNLNKFMKESLAFALVSPVANVTYTYESTISNTKSLIDHFLVSDNLMRHVTQYRAVHKGDNLSDHSYVMIIINVPNLTMRTVTPDCKPQDGIAWNKASAMNICKYKCCFDSRFKHIYIPWEVITCNEIMCKKHKIDELNQFYMEIIDAYLQAVQCSLSSLKQRVNCRKSVPSWSNYVAEKCNKSIFGTMYGKKTIPLLVA